MFLNIFSWLWGGLFVIWFSYKSSSLPWTLTDLVDWGGLSAETLSKRGLKCKLTRPVSLKSLCFPLGLIKSRPTSAGFSSKVSSSHLVKRRWIHVNSRLSPPIAQKRLATFSVLHVCAPHMIQTVCQAILKTTKDKEHLEFGECVWHSCQRNKMHLWVQKSLSVISSYKNTECQMISARTRLETLGKM